MPRACRVLVCALALAAAGLGACGGRSGAGTSPASPPGAGEAGANGQGGATAEAAEADPPRPPRCDDGTCFPCGAQACMAGEFCDESAPGGPACSWVPECLPRATCACLAGVLGSGCRCEARGVGAAVVCS